MGIFSRIKTGISSKANAAIDKAIDPAKELEMAILELEDGRKKALAELVSYKVTAKQLDADVEKHKAKAVEWERRAMLAIKAGDDESAKQALREKKSAETEAAKIDRDKHEAASYAIQLNKSRKDFETKLQLLKMRKGTLATQLAAARSPGGDAFGNDSSVWDRFQAAEDRIDSEAIATEVDAAMRGEDAEAQAFDAKLAAVAGHDALRGLPEGPDDALSRLKDKMADQKATQQKQLATSAAPAADASSTPGSGASSSGASSSGASSSGASSSGTSGTK
jgi:phage shock protein A